MALERLQKVLAQAGCGSRRKCEEYIVAGRVSVDGAVVTELGTKVDPERQQIQFDGQRVRAERPIYLAVNKPRGVVSTTDDPQGRPLVTDLVSHVHQRLFCVGRLDAGSEGLMILTNDGAFANRVLHPRYQVAKTYAVEVRGALTSEELTKLQTGVYVAGRPARAQTVKVMRHRAGNTAVELTLAEGRKRIVRRMFRALDHPVVRLVRTHIGPVALGDLAPAAHRRLTPEEVNQLLALSGQKTPASAPPAGRRRRRTRKPSPEK